MLRMLADRIRHSDYFKAFYETFTIWAISSLVPVVAIWLVGKTSGQPDFAALNGFTSAWRQFFVPTEVFLYVTAIVAPSIAFMFFHWRARRHVGVYFVLLALIFVLFVFTAIVYAVSKTAPTVDEDFVFIFAISVYVLAIVAWYFTQVFQYRLGQLAGEPRPESGASISLDVRE